MNLEKAENILKQWQDENRLADLLEAMCIIEKAYIEKKYLIYDGKFCYDKNGIKRIKKENANYCNELAGYVLMARTFKADLLDAYMRLLDLFE